MAAGDAVKRAKAKFALQVVNKCAKLHAGVAQNVRVRCSPANDLVEALLNNAAPILACEGNRVERNTGAGACGACIPEIVLRRALVPAVIEVLGVPHVQVEGFNIMPSSFAKFHHR